MPLSPPAALVQAIRESPQDEAPRLALADWHKEQGDEALGQYLELQLLAARHPSGSREHEDLASQARKLALEPTRGGFNAVPGHEGLRFEYLRGAPEHLQGTLADLARAADALSQAAPLVHTLLVLDAGDAEQLQRLVGAPFFAQVRSAVISFTRPGAFEALLDSGRLGALESLRLAGRHVALQGWAKLSGRAGLDRLRTLELEAPNSGQWLRQARHLAPLPALDTLKVPWVKVDLEDLAGLVDSPLFPRLLSLDLSGCGLSAEKAGVLAAARASRLRELQASGSQLDDAGLRVLLGWKHPGLARLGLAHTQLTDAAVPLLLEATCLKDLQHLDLGGIRFSAGASEALRARFGAAVRLAG